jgi:hypothetical protein
MRGTLRNVSQLTTSKFNPILDLSYFRCIRPAIACKSLSEIKDQWKEFDVLGIDEGQFFEDVSILYTTLII